MTNDLISREKVLKLASPFTQYDEGGWGMDVRAVTVEDIESIPAVDAAPVVHGRWVLKTRWDTDGALIVTAECSEGCENEREIWRGYFIGVPDYIAEHTALSNAKMARLSNYCPNCGARMDKEESDV